MNVIAPGKLPSEADIARLVKLLDKHGFWLDHTLLPATYNKTLQGAVADFQATALGPNGKPLKVDAVVGEKTWWALRNYRGDAQKLSIPNDKIPKGLSETRQAILRTLLYYHEIGVKETPMGSNRGKVIDQLLPKWWIEKYGDARPKVKGPAWCCFTYMTTYKNVTGRYILGRQQGSCAKAAAKARKLGIYVEAGEDIPIPGDCGILLHGNGKGHAVTVYRVSKDGKRITTVEGNCSNRVAIRERTVASFDGFIRADDGEESRDFQRGLVKAKRAGSDTTR